MPRQDEVTTLLLRMTKNAERGDSLKTLQVKRCTQSQLAHLTPYKAANVWPGRSFSLVGNSFYIEHNLMSAQFELKRSACIAMMLEQGRNTRRCVYLNEALTNEGFVEVLSRFERDWLNKLPPGTVIGPAYGADGELLSQSFSVWRIQEELSAFA